MDKKVLTALIAEITAEIAAKQGIEEPEARTLLGIALKKNRAALVQAVVVPSLGLAPRATEPAPAPAEQPAG